MEKVVSKGAVSNEKIIYCFCYFDMFVHLFI